MADNLVLARPALPADTLHDPAPLGRDESAAAGIRARGMRRAPLVHGPEIGLVSSVSKHLGQEREESARVKEQGRLLYELHDTAKQEVHGISLTLRAALNTERRGDREEALEMFGDLDVISTPGRGTSVQVRFRKRQNTANP